MKTSIKYIIISGFLFFSTVALAQIQVNNGTTSGISGSNVLFDGSTGFSTEAGAGAYQGKGIVVPSVDLVNFLFDLSLADGATFPTFFDGMIVYNNASGTTLTSGNRSSTATVVAPGFYYFSNPNGFNNGEVTSGRWLPLGSSAVSVKSKTVTATATGTSATLPLATLDDSDLVTFLGAKIYDGTGKLVMTADSDYDAATNVLNTGNGFMYQVLAAGTYTVIVDYK